MIFTELVVTCIIALLVYMFFKFIPKLYKRYKFIQVIDKLPGPPAYPVVGNALTVLMVSRNEFMQVIQSRLKQYGGMFRTWNGPFGVIHIARPEYLEIIMNSTKHTDKSMVYTFLQPWMGTGLLTSSGPKWQSHRKMITPAFHFKILEIFMEVFVEKSQILVDKLSKLPKDTAMDLYPYITHCALDIICETAMGTSINSQDDNNSEYVSAIYEISELTLFRMLRFWFHSDFLFYRSSYGRRYKQSLNILHGFTDKIIKERKIARAQKLQELDPFTSQEKDDFGTKKRLAFLDLLLESSEQGSQLSDLDIREEVDTFMFEGHDTTTAAICWTLLLLGSHPQVQDKVVEELDSIFMGSERAVTTRDIHEMKYLEQVIKEALRLFPSVPLVSRAITQETQLGDYLAPAGCEVTLDIFHTHRCTDQWGPEPDKFDPDNFLPERVKSRHPYAYVPFSAGPRNCIGQKFAMLEEKTVISTILRHLRVEALERVEDVKLLIDLILRPQFGLKVKLFPRKKVSC